VLSRKFEDDNTALLAMPSHKALLILHAVILRINARAKYNDTSKPPPASSKYSNPDAAFAYLGTLELIDPAEVGTYKWPPDPGEVGTSKRPPDPGAVGTLEWPPDPGAVGTFEWTPDPGGCLGA
jgi:hypothetical protein